MGRMNQQGLWSEKVADGSFRFSGLLLFCPLEAAWQGTIK